MSHHASAAPATHIAAIASYAAAPSAATSGPDAIMEEINASIGFDRRLYAQDIEGSKAHARMLAEQGIISKSDAAEIRRGLDHVQAEIAGGTFTLH